MQIYAIVDGKVLPYILDPNFEKYLPVIPSEVSITSRSGEKIIDKSDYLIKIDNDSISYAECNTPIRICH